MIQTASIIYCSLILFTICFQIGLIFGQPWGEYTMGGYQSGKLPTTRRIIPFVSIVILTSIGLYILQVGGLSPVVVKFPGFFRIFIIVFNVISVILNSITQSAKERRLWQPITIILLLLSIYLLLIASS